MPVDQWEELLGNRIREKELRERIRENIRYRRNGIQKGAGVNEYEELKLQREKKKEAKKRMQVCEKLFAWSCQKLLLILVFHRNSDFHHSWGMSIEIMKEKISKIGRAFLRIQN